MANTFIKSLGIDNLHEKELGIFCGAGISRNSGIPIVKQFLDYIFTQFGLSDNEKFVLLNDEQPFEKVVETFLRINEDNAKRHLFSCFDNDYLKLKPNATHHWIAKLASERKISFICTTNFDSLLETALKNQKVNYHVYCRDDNENIQTSSLCHCHGGHCKPYYDIDWNSPILKVVKIHSCINAKDTIGITIKKIASQKSLETRMKVVADLFSTQRLNKKVLILGYSSSDIFDIIPVFISLRKTRKIFYLNHGIGEIISKLQKVKSVRGLKENFNPFRKLNGNHFWINGDTNSIINLPISTAITISHEWEQCVDYYVKTFKYGQIDFLCALLFRRSNFFEKKKSDSGLKTALKYYKRAERKFKASNYNLGLGSCYNNAGVILKNMGNLKAALRKYRQASNLFLKEGELLNAGKAIGNEGNIYRHLGDLQKAMDLHHKSLNLFEQVPSLENISICYGDIAVTYTDLKDYTQSLLYHKKEMELCIQLGDVEGLAECYLNLSKVFRLLDKPRKALILCNKAEKIFKETKNSQQMSTCYINKAIIYDYIGKPSLALKLHKKGQEISSQYHDIYNLILSYSNQAQIFKGLNKLSDAKKLVKKSLELVKKIGYKQLENDLHVLFNLKNRY